MQQWKRILAGLTLAATLACGGSTLEITDADSVGDENQDLKAPKPTGKYLGTYPLYKDFWLREIPFRFDHHGGPLMMGTANVYFIWYGLWGSSPVQPVVTDMVQNLGGSRYWNIVTSYKNASGVALSNAVQYSGTFEDVYSMGTTLKDSDVQLVVSQTIAAGFLPPDPDGVYFVMLGSDVDAPGLCKDFCAYHNNTNANGVQVKYALIGNPDRCPTKCAAQAKGPNGTSAGDAMANLVVGELFNSVTDPTFSGYYDYFGFEGADKCSWTFGQQFTSANGAKANVTLGARDFLLQRLWVNRPQTRNAESRDDRRIPNCALSYTATP